MKMLLHPHSLNKRTLYALDLTPLYSNHTNTQYTSILIACADNSQLFGARCAAVSQIVGASRRKFCTLGTHNSAGSKTLWITLLSW
jgi:hypothetical protein